MRKTICSAVSACALLIASGSALANDLEGNVESVNKANQSFVVQGIEFHATEATDYEDGLQSFDDLSEGQKVEVDFEYRDGKHYVTEVELD